MNSAGRGVGPAGGPIPDTTPDPAHPGSGGTARYLVEVGARQPTHHDIQQLADEARRGATEAAAAGVVVRFLRVVFLPDDGSCLLLFEAESEAAVRMAVANAGLGAQRRARRVAVHEPEGAT